MTSEVQHAFWELQPGPLDEWIEKRSQRCVSSSPNQHPVPYSVPARLAPSWATRKRGRRTMIFWASFQSASCLFRDALGIEASH